MKKIETDGITVKTYAKGELYLNMTAEDWELFTSKGYKQMADPAAAILNKTAKELVRNGCDIDTFVKKMKEMLCSFRGLGGEDSEPQWKLKHLTRQIFKDDYIDF